MASNVFTNAIILLILSSDTAFATWQRVYWQSCKGGFNCKVLSCKKPHRPPVDGAWSQWSIWTQCSHSCGGGLKVRRRTCNTPPPQYGGKPCWGRPFEESCCNAVLCPVDAQWSEWGPWGQCSKTCGKGERMRRRQCNQPSRKFYAKPCRGQNVEITDCNDTPCTVEGSWTNWGPWSSCSNSCGGGFQQRTRSCTKPKLQNGGQACLGLPYATSPCNDHPCQIDGGWSDWSAWSRCSKTCSKGERTRTRLCNRPLPLHNGKPCKGDNTELDICSDTPCPVDGGWSNWGSWTTCSKSCDGGLQQRTRSCTEPKPQKGGQACSGRSYATMPCNEHPCQIDGGWSDWSAWSHCSKTCGKGERKRTRLCNRPLPVHNGKPCQGYNTELDDCNDTPCPVDGGWSDWSVWSQCSKTCGQGERTRTRLCNTPPPLHNGKPCQGDTTEIEGCIDTHCPVDGNWSKWGAWSSCSKSCGGGLQKRTRSCTEPQPQNGGKACPGRSYTTSPCNENPCQVDGGWSEWSAWSLCSKTCGDGERTRKRICNSPPPLHNGKPCQGDTTEIEECLDTPCPVDGSWSNWGEWSTCSNSCGGGFQQRTRSCTEPKPQHGGNACPGRSYTTSLCNENPCQVDGGWSDWSAWSRCSKTCGNGERTRMRLCNSPTPLHNGKPCQGDTSEIEGCSDTPCPEWSTWGKWSQCTRTCGIGIQVRTRSCDQSNKCPGQHTEERQCLSGPCPV